MEYLSKGNTAELYAYSDDKVCKLFIRNYPESYVQHEYDMMLYENMR